METITENTTDQKTENKRLQCLVQNDTSTTHLLHVMLRDLCRRGGGNIVRATEVGSLLWHVHLVSQKCQRSYMQEISLTRLPYQVPNNGDTVRHAHIEEGNLKGLNHRQKKLWATGGDWEQDKVLPMEKLPETIIQYWVVSPEIIYIQVNISEMEQVIFI